MVYKRILTTYFTWPPIEGLKSTVYKAIVCIITVYKAIVFIFAVFLKNTVDKAIVSIPGFNQMMKEDSDADTSIGHTKNIHI